VQFLALNALDAGAEQLLRSQSREVQRRVIDDGVCMGSNPSAVCISRVRKLLGLPGTSTAVGVVSIGDGPISLEAFIRENELDESAVKALMEVPIEVQQRVMAEGIVTGRNKSAILVGRIRRCLCQPGASGALTNGSMAPPKGNTDPSAGFGREQLEHFVQVNNLDPHAEKVLREQPSDIQARVVGEGPVTGDNKSRIVMGRIRRSQGTGRFAGTAGIAGILSGPQPSPYLPGAVGTPAPGVEEFIRINQLDSLAERELLALPPERQVLVMGEGEVTGSNKSAVVMGRIRRVNQGELPGLNTTRPDGILWGSLAGSAPPPPMAPPPMETFAAAAHMRMQHQVRMQQEQQFQLFQQQMPMQMPMQMLQQQLQQQQLQQQQQSHVLQLSRSSRVVPGPDAGACVRTITDLLRDRVVLKKAVVQSFKKVDGGTDSVSINGLQQFRTILSQVIGVPAEAFGDLVNTYICFDFDGNGMLEVNEVYKLVKHHLREYRKKLGFNDNAVDMPMRTLPEAGYQVLKELGRGSQGVVKLANNRQGQEVCVKCLDKAAMSASGLEELQEEFQTLQQLGCERIARVFELFQDTQFYYMVGEPYHGGDLMTLKPRAQAQGVAMSEQWYRTIWRQCFDALGFMHEQAMMHCDIKEPNIMLKTSDFHRPEIVLIDFGVSRAMAAKPNGMPGGTPGYIPPETLDTRTWFPRGDIFSMGVTIMQVVTDKIPPTGARTVHTPGGIFVEGCLTIQDIMQATKTREPPYNLLASRLPGITKLTMALLSKQMKTRPTAPQVLKDAWFAAGPAPVVERIQPRGKGLATIGITKSFLARPSVADEDLPEALAALREVHQTVSGPVQA